MNPGPATSLPYVVRLLLAALALAMAGACPAASDADLKVPGRDSPLSGRLGAVGLILPDEGGGHSVGSGFLVSPCHVLTAAHVLTRDGAIPKLGMGVRFAPVLGKRMSDLDHRLLHGTLVAAGSGFVAQNSPAETLDVKNAAADWALVELERPLDEIAPIKLLYPGAQAGALTAVGFPLSRHTLLIHAHENCAGHGYHGTRPALGLLVVDCAVREGMSGGPLLVDAGGELIVAGIIVERLVMGSRPERVAALAVSTGAFADQVAPAMRASRVCAVGMPFAQPPDSGLETPAAAGLQSSGIGRTKSSSGTDTR